MRPLQIKKVEKNRQHHGKGSKRKHIRKDRHSSAHGSIQYDFSANTINSLITTVKGLPDLPSDQLRDNRISMIFSHSLRLLDVRSIICLMQACHAKHIDLPDIHKIDWLQPFNNTSNDKDIRLFSNTFDDQRRSLLISLYLTGYGNQNAYSLLKQFVRDYDVPINMVDDKGDSIIHHMIRRKDYDGIYELLNALKLNQKFNFDIKNDLGDTVIHEMIRENNCDELTHLLNIIHLKVGKSLRLNTFNDSGESLVYFAMQQDWRTLKDLQRKDKNADADIYPYEDETIDLSLIIDAKQQDQTVIEYDTFVNIMYCIHPKKHGTLVDDTNPKHIAIKTRVDEYQNNLTNLCDKQKAKYGLQLPKKQLLHHVLINYDPQIIANSIHSQFQQTALGNVLDETYFDDIGPYFDAVVGFLLTRNAPLFLKEVSSLATLFIHVLTNKFTLRQRRYYFDVFEKTIQRCAISVSNVCDKDGNNPLHNVIKIPKKESSSRRWLLLSSLSYLCDKYPEWMSMQNHKGLIPLYYAIQQKDIDFFYLLCRHMSQHDMDMTVYLSERKYVQKMIEFGCDLLKNASVTILKLLFATFDYSQLFLWTSHSQTDTFDASPHSKDISLIKYVSTRDHKHTIDQILFEQCSVDKSHNNEFCDEDTKHDEMQNESEYDSEEHYEANEDEEKEQQKDNTSNGKHYDRQTTTLLSAHHESIDWIELVYSTVVETFSALDLCTDVLILLQLYHSGNQWWTTWMLILLASPYLVSHGSLVVILQNKKKFDTGNRSCFTSTVLSFWESLLMTPMALFYLCFIDFIFMIFALLSSVWLLFGIIRVVTSCQTIDQAAEYDCREWIDQKIFKDWLRMNRSEIVGYRRLRTLSQLFFETIPEIVLQLRILWVIKWSGSNENTFEIDVTTLIWSLGLAFAHLFLESGIIYLDKSAYQMGFMDYSLECLGGRVQWIPFQHLLPNIIENQVYIHHHGHRKYFDTANFDAATYTIDVDHEETDEAKRALLTLDYEQISAPIKCINYSASYQFSPYTMNQLTQRLTNCPELILPFQFNLGKNVVIENLFRHILCRAEIRFGSSSFGTVDYISLCNLYRASFNKINLNIQSDNMLSRLQSNVGRVESLDHKIKEEIRRSLICFGEIAAVEWAWSGTLSSDEILNIQWMIMRNCLPSTNDDLQFLRLDILRNCYKHRFYVGTHCSTMERITATIMRCYGKAKQDESWYFVIMFVLLYSRGTIFGVHCSNECCVLHPSLKQTLLKHFVPTYVELNKLKIPFQLFESCQCYRPIYRKYIEHILINNCKTFMITSDTTCNKEVFVISEPNAFDLAKRAQSWSVFAGNRSKSDINNQIAKLLFRIQHKQIENWTIILLDKLIFVTKMYIGYHEYLRSTIQFRELSNHTALLKFDYFDDDFINIEQLIPGFDRKERYQIYQLTATITTAKDERRSNVTEDDVLTIYFESTIQFDDTKSKITNEATPNTLYLWISNTSELDAQPQNNIEKIKIDVKNVTLGYYNYHLLHCEENIPSIKIKSKRKFKMRMKVKYTKLYQKQKPNVRSRSHVVGKSALLSIETAGVLDLPPRPEPRTPSNQLTPETSLRIDVTKMYRNRYRPQISMYQEEVQEQITAMEDARKKAAARKYTKANRRKMQRFDSHFSIPDDTPITTPVGSTTKFNTPSETAGSRSRLSMSSYVYNRRPEQLSPIQSTPDGVSPLPVFTPATDHSHLTPSYQPTDSPESHRLVQNAFAKLRTISPPLQAREEVKKAMDHESKQQDTEQDASDFVMEDDESKRFEPIKQLQEEREEEERRQQEAEKQRLERERKEKEQQRQDADAESRKLEIERQAEERANRKRRQHPTTVLQESLSTEASTPVHGRPKSPAPNRRLPPLMTPKMMTNKSYDTAQMHSKRKTESEAKHASYSSHSLRYSLPTKPLPQLTTFLTLTEAQQLPGTTRNREDSLSPDDFYQVFGFTKEEFKAMKKWKQNKLKKQHGLF
eukprot:715584_1